MVRRTPFRAALYIGFLAICLIAAAPVRAAEPVTITFQDIFGQPFDREWLPPFLWRGVLFSGGALRRDEAFAVTYEGRGRTPVQMQFPQNSTDVSFDVDGWGEAVYFTSERKYLPIQIWNGDDGTGQLVETLPVPAELSSIWPPTHKVKIPGPVFRVTVYMEPPSPRPFDYRYYVVIDNVRYTPPDPEPTITFDAVLPQHARVLAHNYGAYPYPSPLQTQDGAIRVQATVTVNNQPAPGKTIHFRLIDPPDAASYVKQAGDDSNGDNFDGSGSLNAPGQTTATAVSDGAGRVTVTLHTTSFAAGDNYQIEASGKENFPCALSCAKSAVYTAWKRIYVEYHKMFQRGAYLMTDVPPGAKALQVDNVDGLPTPPFEIRLLHAARVDAPSGDFSTAERAVVVRIDRDGKGLAALFGLGSPSGTLFLDPSPDVPGLQRAYSGPEKVGNDERSYLADAVGVVTGNRAADFLLANGTLVNSLMDQAFTEYVWLTDAAASDPDLLLTQPRLPFDGVLPRKWTVGGEGLDYWQREWLTRKWLRNAARQGVERVAEANHQALFTTGEFWADGNSASNLGLTTVGSNFNDAWLAIDALGGQGRIAEAAAHELTHQWRVNGGPPNPHADGGHCGRIGLTPPTALLIAGSASRYCLMTLDIFEYPENHDGIVGFHYVKFGGSADSEYLRIRRRAEPVPQNDFQRDPPQ